MPASFRHRCASQQQYVFITADGVTFRSAYFALTHLQICNIDEIHFEDLEPWRQEQIRGVHRITDKSERDRPGCFHAEFSVQDNYPARVTAQKESEMACSEQVIVSYTDGGYRFVPFTAFLVALSC